MHDADFLREAHDAGKIRKALFIGGGLIGMETCEALQLEGIELTVVEMLPQTAHVPRFRYSKASREPCRILKGQRHHW